MTFTRFSDAPSLSTEYAPGNLDHLPWSDVVRTLGQGFPPEPDGTEAFLDAWVSAAAADPNKLWLSDPEPEVAAETLEDLSMFDEPDAHHHDVSSRPDSLFDTLSGNWEVDEERIVTWRDVGNFALKWSGIKAIRSLVGKLRGTDSPDGGVLASQTLEDTGSRPSAKPRHEVYEPPFSMEDPTSARRKRFVVAAVFAGITVLGTLTVPAALEMADAGFRTLSLY